MSFEQRKKVYSETYFAVDLRTPWLPKPAAGLTFKLHEIELWYIFFYFTKNYMRKRLYTKKKKFLYSTKKVNILSLTTDLI